MTKKELEQLEKLLVRERERVIKALRQLDDSVSPTSGDGDLTTYPLHLADEGTDTMEQEQSFMLLSKEGRLLIDIDVALRTLYKEPERFGRCLNCDQAIAFARLEVIPWTRMCLTCQQAFEELPVPSGNAA
jgi:DnaK suppressor protein